MTRSRSSKTVIVLLVAVLAVLIRGTRQQRIIRRTFVHFMALSWISDRADDIAGFIGGIGSGIKGFVVAVIQTVVDWAQSLFDWIGQRLHDIESLAWAVYSAAIDFAQGVYDRATAFASWVAAMARQYASDLVSWAVNVAQSLFDQVMGFAQAVLRLALQFAQDIGQWAVSVAQTLVNAAIGFAQSLFDHLAALVGWVYDTVTGLLRAGIDAVIGLVHALVDAAVSALRAAIDAAVGALRAVLDAAVDGLRALIDAAVNGLRALIDATLGPITGYLFGTVRSVIDVVSTVLDWLIAIAEFPFTTARDIWAAFRQTGGQRIMQAMPESKERWGATVFAHSVDYYQSTDRDYQLPPTPDRSSSGTPDAGELVLMDTIVTIAERAGLTGQAARVAAAIAMAESGGNPNAHNSVPPDDSYGLWQINMINELGPARRARFGIASNSELYDPDVNARAMVIVSGGGVDWSPWSTFNNGAYRRFLIGAA